MSHLPSLFKACCTFVTKSVFKGRCGSILLTTLLMKNSNPSNHLSVEKKDPYLSVQKVDSSNREGTHSSNTRNPLMGSMHEMDSLFNLMKGHQDKEKT